MAQLSREQNTSGNIRYRDIDISFLRNPITNDISIKNDTDAVKQAVVNLVKTLFYERPFAPEKGCGLYRNLFEQLDEITKDEIMTAVQTVLTTYEPRVILRKVDVSGDDDHNQLTLTIIFSLVNSNTPISQTVLLKRVR